jgi:hypothetical protein
MNLDCGAAAMKDYTEVEPGVYQSNNTQPKRKVEEDRIRQIVRDNTPEKPQEQRKSARPPAPAQAIR